MHLHQFSLMFYSVFDARIDPETPKALWFTHSRLPRRHKYKVFLKFCGALGSPGVRNPQNLLLFDSNAFMGLLAFMLSRRKVHTVIGFCIFHYCFDATIDREAPTSQCFRAFHVSQVEVFCFLEVSWPTGSPRSRIQQNLILPH